MNKLHIESVQSDLLGKACARLDSFTKPQGSLGRLEEFAKKLVLLTGQEMPHSFSKKAIFTFAGDHGVVEEGISLFPKEVTIQMVYNFLRGGAAINVLARHAGVDEVVIDIGVDYDFGEEKDLLSRKVIKGTKNMRKGPAMTREEAQKCIDTGIELALKYAEKGYNIFGTGEMGIGNPAP
jgi:nicotinate-nucleotide--dimethylbenzimidazole phosphoribosyltransferase